MAKYELTVVLPGEATAAKKKKIKQTIEKTIKTLKGKIENEDDWGKIGLASEVKGEKSGNFLHYLLELEEDKAKNLQQKLKVEEEIIRYLLVRSEEE